MLNVAKWQSGVVANDISPTVFHFGTKTHYPLLAYSKSSQLHIKHIAKSYSQGGTETVPAWD